MRSNRASRKTEKTGGPGTGWVSARIRMDLLWNPIDRTLHPVSMSTHTNNDANEHALTGSHSLSAPGAAGYNEHCKKGPGACLCIAYALPNPLRLRNSANERARSAPSPDQCSRLSGFNLDVILAEPMNMGTWGYRQGHRYLKAGQDRISSRARGSLARDPSARSAVDSVGRGLTLFLPSIRLPMDRSTLRHSKAAQAPRKMP